MLRPSQSCNLSPDPLPIESRIKQDKSGFEEQQRQRVAQEARAERKQKKQVRGARLLGTNGANSVRVAVDIDIAQRITFAFLAQGLICNHRTEHLMCVGLPGA